MIRKLGERGLLLPVAAGVAVAGILIHGALTREAPGLPETAVAPAPTPAPPPPTTVPPLRRALDAVPLRYQSEYWLQLGDRARRRLVAIGSPVLTGVLVAPGVALTSLDAVGEDAADGSRGVERLLGFDELLGAALFELPEEVAPTAFELAPAESLSPGSLLAAVGLGRDHRLRVAPGALISAPTELAFEASLDLHLGLPDDFGAAAIVDLDGRLAGFAVSRGPGRAHVFPAPVLTLLTSHLRNRRFCHALEVADLQQSVAEIADVRGVLVERVRSGAFVPEPSVLPGDVLLEWDGQGIERADAFRAQYESTPPGERVAFRVRRGRANVRGVTLMPDLLCRPVGPSPLELAGLGLAARWVREGDLGGAETGWLVVSLAEAGVAARGGVQKGDWLLRLDGRPLDTREASSLLETLDRRPRPALLSVRRDGRHRMLALDPPEDPDA